MSSADLASLRAAWDQAAVRGCMVCEHGTGPATERRCTCSDVTRGGAPVDVHHARSNAGQCGPEARHMYFAGLYTR